MEKPKYLSAINISIYVIIIILTIIKLVLNFTETVYSASVICDIIFNFIILICSIIVIPIYKLFWIRMILAYSILFMWIGALVTSLLSYQYILNDSNFKGIYNFASYTKLTLCFASYMLSIFDDDFDD